MRFGPWFRLTSSESPRKRCAAPRSRVPIPAAVEPPADLLRDLQRWDRRLDLYVFPDGRTWVLLKSDSEARIHEGRRQLAEGREDGLPDRSTLLMAAGYELLHEERGARAQSAGHLLRVIREKMNATMAEIDAELARLEHISDGMAGVEHAVQTVKDRIRSDAASDWRWAHKGKKAFSRVM